MLMHLDKKYTNTMLHLCAAGHGGWSAGNSSARAIRIFYINEDAKLQKAFCSRFRLPYQQYLKLVEDICSSELFDRWCGYKSNNKKVLPVELLILGLLCYLGCGWTFNNCEESTAIDKDVHRIFFMFSSSSA
jgi:hypothetical protein